MEIETPASVCLGITVRGVKRPDTISLGKKNYHVWVPGIMILNMDRSNSFITSVMAKWHVLGRFCLYSWDFSSLEKHGNVHLLKINDANFWGNEWIFREGHFRKLWGYITFFFLNFLILLIQQKPLTPHPPPSDIAILDINFYTFSFKILLQRSYFISFGNCICIFCLGLLETNGKKNRLKDLRMYIIKRNDSRKYKISYVISFICSFPQKE